MEEKRKHNRPIRMKKLNMFFLPAAFIVVIMILQFSNNYSHENAHKAISIHNGCLNYEIEYFPNPHFQCLKYKEEIYPETEYLLHSMNEVVSYNNNTTWLTMFFGFLLLASITIFTKKK